MSPNKSHSFTRWLVMTLCVAMFLALAAAAAPQPAQAAVKCVTYHIAKKSDTTSFIAHTYGLKWKEIALANNLKEPYRFKDVQVLCIPAAGTIDTEGNYPTTAKAVLTAYMDKFRLHVILSGVSRKGVFVVKVRDAYLDAGGYTKLGNLKIEKNEKVSQVYPLPKSLYDAGFLDVCLKNSSTDELVCRTILNYNE